MCNMCWLCDFKTPAPSARLRPAHARRGFLLAGAAAAVEPALAQVDVGKPSGWRNLVPAETLERSAQQQYLQTLQQAEKNNALAPEGHPQLERIRKIARRLIPFTAAWNPQARHWRWEVNLIGSRQINAWCMPGGKIAFYTGILDTLQLSDDEAAMVMGHEMAHALREHARERLAKTRATGMGLSIASQLLGLGQAGNMAADLGTQLLSLKFSREDETEADIVGLEIAARGGYRPEASVSLWQKMQSATGSKGSSDFLSTHPSGPHRIRELEANLPKVQGLYEDARNRQP